MSPKDQIKENLSILDVVSTYIRLEKSGQQFRAKCPFHNEKTPSFYVSPERKSFHCFGCQVHGDIFSFVEKIENIPFYEALKILADRAGIKLVNKEKSKEETRLVILLKDTTEYFKQNLDQSPEKRKYLLDRGLTEETIKIFHIGFAKNEWRDLFIYLSSKSYSPEEMEQAGLEIKAMDEKGNLKGWYDRFRGRIMFPIRNVSGVTVGFSGRILPEYIDEAKTQGKYVNTPETVLYHKSKILFGYDTAKKKMMESKFAVVVEGQMDLCMSYQAGVHNTVAVSGTAFTDEHINLIKRFCDTVVLSFDKDQAGQNALKKTSMLCLLGGLDVYVVSDFGTKDPADLIKENSHAWIEAVEKRNHIVEYMISFVMREEKESRKQWKKIVTEVIPFLKAIQSPIDRSHFVKLVSQKSGIPEDTVLEELKRGGSLAKVEEYEENLLSVPTIERLEKEIIAYATLTGQLSDQRIISLGIDIKKFPESIIQEEMFRLEERVIVNKEKYFDDLIKTYKKESHKEVLIKLQKKLREEVEEKDTTLKEIYDHAKKGINL